MSTAPWPELAALYDTPPELSSCPLYYVHVDERDTAVTLGFETARLPDHPEPEWARRAYNTLRFFVVFTGVEDLRMTGLAAGHPDGGDRVLISGSGCGSGDGRRRVTVTGTGRSLSFSAAASAVTRTRVYLQGSV
ncbi:Imm50 family immunity protein [Streptomyces erythrochromogenes]|uniref:Imm50 family immunity protein n=1 Tax=Streptomyces erythrochromogenes TaxID=285574 RepID=UPI003696828C